MQEADLDSVLELTNAAFGQLVERNSGRRPPHRLFSPLLGSYRLALDPDGCHVAVRGGGVVGANFSVLRGTLAWFGPLAVRPDSQGLGIAQALVVKFLAAAEARGAKLTGLETMAASSQHIHLYQKFGFRPSWTGISYRGAVRDGSVPREVERDGTVPALDYLYPGFDATNDARGTRGQKVGATFTLEDGFAVCHTTNSLWPEDTLAYIPLIAARHRRTFDQLLHACEAVAHRSGKTHVVTQVPGSSWHTQAALLEYGYKPGGASLRMKRGDHLGYDSGDFFYCDDWH